MPDKEVPQQRCDVLLKVAWQSSSCNATIRAELPTASRLNGGRVKARRSQLSASPFSTGRVEAKRGRVWQFVVWEGLRVSPVARRRVGERFLQRGLEDAVSEKKALKKINAKAIMTDLKDGLTDGQLMEKYALSFQGLQDLFSKLVEAKLATRAYFDKRAMKQTKGPAQEDELTTCPYCGYSSDAVFDRCPQCNQDTSEWLDTVELTKILTGSFE